jgi:hypothetical protein
VTGITYSPGGTQLGNLTYTYDADGRVTSKDGTMASTGMPAPVSGNTFNAANQMTPNLLTQSRLHRSGRPVTQKKLNDVAGFHAAAPTECPAFRQTGGDFRPRQTNFVATAPTETLVSRYLVVAGFQNRHYPRSGGSACSKFSQWAMKAHELGRTIY